MFTEEDYVSLETAKLLKEKGFDEPCERFYCEMYDSIQDTFSLRFRNVSYKELEGGDILIPTLYEAQKWILSNGLYVCPKIYENMGWYFAISKVKSGELLHSYLSIANDLFTSLPQSLDAGIQEALKLI